MILSMTVMTSLLLLGAGLGAGLITLALSALWRAQIARRTAQLEDLVQKRTAELQESARERDALLSHLPGIVFRCRLDDHLTPVQLAGQTRELTGYDAEEFTSGAVAFAARMHPEDRAGFKSWLARLAAEPEYGECVFRLSARDETTRWLWSRAHAVRDQRGAPAFLEGLIVDLTAQKEAEAGRLRAERRLLDAQRLEGLGRLAGGAAHDFNNLLTGILGHTSLARLDLREGVPAGERLDQIETAAQGAVSLCQQLLAYSGKGRFTSETIDLNGLVRDVTALLQPSLGAQASVVLALAEDLPPLVADAVQIRRVVVDLIQAAAKAIGAQPGRITLTTCAIEKQPDTFAAFALAPEFPAERFVSLQIDADGGELDTETLARIFEPFVPTRVAPRGMGLAAALGVVRGHRGALHVANRPGAGSTFAFYLPAGQSRESIDADSLTPWRGRGTVLIIDDEDTVRSVARKVLEVFGLQVIEATSGTRGLELLRRHLDEIRLVMLDVVLPDLDGAKALRKIGAIRNDLPVILMSGYPEPPAQAVAGGPVSVSFLPKPFDAPTLLALVQKVVPGNQLPSGNEVL